MHFSGEVIAMVNIKQESTGIKGILTAKLPFEFTRDYTVNS